MKNNMMKNTILFVFVISIIFSAVEISFAGPYGNRISRPVEKLSFFTVGTIISVGIGSFFIGRIFGVVILSCFLLGVFIWFVMDFRRVKGFFTGIRIPLYVVLTVYCIVVMMEKISR